jgi:hypothetical protein
MEIETLQYGPGLMALRNKSGNARRAGTSECVDNLPRRG